MGAGHFLWLSASGSGGGGEDCGGSDADVVAQNRVRSTAGDGGDANKQMATTQPPSAAAVRSADGSTMMRSVCLFIHFREKKVAGEKCVCVV